MRDISEVRALEQLKSDFVATVSHELRTPLTSIYGFAETLLREDASFGEEDRATFVRYIASEAERLNRLVEACSAPRGSRRARSGCELAPVDVAAVARDVASWAGGRSEQHKLALVLPPGGALADADADRVRQVLINLIDNAIKYSPDGGTVTVRVRKRRRVVELRVSDEGIGISERDQRNLFQKFFRVDAAMSRGIRGIGLGLYLVRGFVTAMGGRIWVESEQGKGSTFVVELPASDAPRPRPSAVRSPDARSARSSSSTTSRRSACSAASTSRPRASASKEAADGAAAMTLAREWHPDLILLDVMMPGEDGFAVAERIRDDPDAGRRARALPDGARRHRRSRALAQHGRRRPRDEAVQPLVAGRRGRAALRAQLAEARVSEADGGELDGLACPRARGARPRAAAARLSSCAAARPASSRAPGAARGRS